MKMMKQGTTPVVDFKTTYTAKDMSSLYFVFTQSGQRVLEKGLTDAVWGDSYVAVNLTKAETYLFKPGLAHVQMGGDLVNGMSARTVSYYFTVDKADKQPNEGGES